MPSRYVDFEEGTLTIDDLDEDEIMRGQLRNRNGDFTGRPPAVIPRAFLDAVKVARQDLIRTKFQEAVPEAIKALLEVAQGAKTIGGGAKVSAATKLLEYAIGKPTETVKLEATVEEVPRWQALLPQILVEIPTQEPAALPPGSDAAPTSSDTPPS